jgi:prepilin-type N-terminal cleavage/methylation domain-containing protein
MKRGFTLLELIIVIVIIGILAVIAMPIYTVNLNKARKAQALATLSGLKDAESAFRVKNGTSYSSSPDINVDLDGDNTDDIAFSLANTTDFKYSINNAGTLANANGLANATAGGESYCMNFNSGCTKNGTTLTSTSCNAGCP